MIVFYNKPLLRFLAVLTGVALAYVGWHYAAGMQRELARQGLLDALAIFGYVAASYLFILVAEVADSHYARAFGGLSLAAGMMTAWNFVRLDIRKLEPAEAAGISGVFATAALLGAVYLAIVIVRLVLDRLNLGRPVISEAARIGAYKGPVEPPAYREPERPVAVPADTCPFCGEKYDTAGDCGCSRVEEIAAQTAPQSAAAKPKREPAPVRRIVGIAGAYSGEVFELTPGEITIGRSEGNAVILAGDNQVSRRHAKINVGEDGMAQIEDVGSTNGTTVDGARIAAATALAPGMSVGIGSTTFRVE